MTGCSVETYESLTERAYALSSYALTCVALMTLLAPGELLGLHQPGLAGLLEGALLNMIADRVFQR